MWLKMKLSTERVFENFASYSAGIVVSALDPNQ